MLLFAHCGYARAVASGRSAEIIVTGAVHDVGALTKHFLAGFGAFGYEMAVRAAARYLAARS